MPPCNALDTKHFDLVIIMPRVADTEVSVTAEKIRAKCPQLPIMLLCHDYEVGLGIPVTPPTIVFAI